MVGVSFSAYIDKLSKFGRGLELVVLGFSREIIEFSNALVYGANFMTSSAVNNCRYGNVFMPIWSALDREIHKLSFVCCMVFCRDYVS